MSDLRRTLVVDETKDETVQVIIQITEILENVIGADIPSVMAYLTSRYGVGHGC